MELKQIIKSGWKGEVELSAAFWWLFVFGQIVLAILLWVLVLPTMFIGPEITQIANKATYPINLVFMVWAMVSIWRCSTNERSAIWRYTAKIFVPVYSMAWYLGYVPPWSSAI